MPSRLLINYVNRLLNSGFYTLERKWEDAPTRDAGPITETVMPVPIASWYFASHEKKEPDKVIIEFSDSSFQIFSFEEWQGGDAV